MVYLLAGISFGLAAGFSPGPLFALVITQTVRHGLKEGIKAAAAPLLTDVPIVLLSLLLLKKLDGFQPILGFVSLSGGIFLVYLAYETMTVKPVAGGGAAKATDSIMRAALVNALSPHPYLFWLTVGGPLLAKAGDQDVVNAVGFVGAFYGSLVGAKILLAILVSRWRDFLAGRAYLYTMKGLGMALLIFALWLFREGWILLFG